MLYLSYCMLDNDAFAFPPMQFNSETYDYMWKIRDRSGNVVNCCKSVSSLEKELGTGAKSVYTCMEEFSEGSRRGLVAVVVVD